MEMVNCPCKGCSERNSRCHTYCKDYKQYSNYRQEISKRKVEIYESEPLRRRKKIYIEK